MAPPPIVLTAHDSASESGSAAQRFPHIRAQLSAIYRQHKGPLEGCEDDDESTGITTTLVTKAAALLGDEREDELKVLLKTSFGVDDDMVCGS